MNQDACTTHPKLSYDQEIALVRELVASDPSHALYHCTSALALAPERTEWHEPLRVLLDDPALSAKLETDLHFGAHAARAHRLHANGDVLGALAIIAQVHATVPHLGFGSWLMTWAEEAVARDLPIDPGAVLPALMLSYSFGIGRMRLLPAEREAAAELAPLAELAMRANDEPRLALLASAVLRRAARFDDAVAAAERARSEPPTEMYLIAKGLAQRGARDFEGALGTFDLARTITGDAVHLAEKVRVLADAGRWTEAIAVWHERAQHGEPDAENQAELAALEHAAETNAPAPDVPPLDDVRRQLLGHGELLRMSDATANALRNVGADEGLRSKGPVGAGKSLRAGKINMAVSGYEGPSNRLCLALMLTGEPDVTLASYTQTTPTGLRRVAPGDDTFATWTLDGDVPVQAVAPPPAHVSAWIERLALHEPDDADPDQLFEGSADFLALWSMVSADRPPAARARDWVAATVFPIMPVSRVCVAPDWTFRWQVVALIGLVHSEAGWKGTEKREALLALLRSTIDWPLAAAIRVAAEVALREPASTRELRLELIGMTDAFANEPNVALARTLLMALSMIPLVPKHHLEKVAAQVAADVADDADDAIQEAPAAPPPATAPKRPWWKLWGSD